MHLSRLLLSLALLSVPAATLAAPAPPLVDGDCSDYRLPGTRTFPVAPGVELHVAEDEHFVWFCYTYPAGSMAQLDMTLKTARLAEPLNLHVSAQLGEWPARKPELAPADPNSDLWWNTRGWTANTLHINGMDTSGPAPRYRWKHTPARELQLSKQRFGGGRWEFALAIYQVKQGDVLRTVNFPAAGTMQSIEVRQAHDGVR